MEAMGWLDVSGRVRGGGELGSALEEYYAARRGDAWPKAGGGRVAGWRRRRKTSQGGGPGGPFGPVAMLSENEKNLIGPLG
jgi:hypothetical protein